MNAAPILIRVARVLRETGLEAVMIGNAAAALQGAPVTTVDVDFLFRKTPANLRKLKKVARALDATILRPYYPVSDLFRIAAEDLALQVDFMATVDGVRSYNSVKSRAISIDVGGEKFLVASLPDIIASKRAADRPRDRAVLDVLTRTLKKQENVAPGETQGPETGK
jgi:predicted nucleotidyltransferase